jgi:hypothetical protein
LTALPAMCPMSPVFLTGQPRLAHRLGSYAEPRTNKHTHEKGSTVRKLITLATAALAVMALSATVAPAARKSEFTFHLDQEDKDTVTTSQEVSSKWEARSNESITETRGNSILGSKLLGRFANQIRTQNAATQASKTPGNTGATKQLNRCSSQLDQV